MNLKSNILKILVVVALISIMIPAIAAEDIDDTSYAADNQADDDSVAIDETSDELEDENLQDESDELTDDAKEGASEELIDEELIDEEIADEEPVADETLKENKYPAAGEPTNKPSAISNIGFADLQVITIPEVQKVKVGDQVIWAVIVANNGPDIARNVFVGTTLLSGNVSLISAIPSTGIYFPDMGLWYVGDLDVGEFAVLYILGEILTDEDAVLFAYAVSDTPDPDPYNNFDISVAEIEGNEVAAESTTMPATGNPIAMVLLALIAIVGATFTRRL